MKTLLSLAAALTLAACGGSGPTTCATNADCQAGQVCNDGLCYIQLDNTGGGTVGGSSTGGHQTGTTGAGIGSSGSSSSSAGTTSSSSSAGSTGSGSASAGTASAGTTGSGSASASAGNTGSGSTSSGSSSSSSSSSSSGGSTGAPPAPLGSACTQGSDCQGGACLLWGNNGYCSGLCTANSDCGTSGACIPSYFDNPDGGLPVSVCAISCTSSSSCPTGDICDTSGSQGFCTPNDCRVDPALCSGTDQCNQVTGGCTASTLPGGYPATFPAVPQVQGSANGVIASPRYVAMFFNNDNDPGAPVSDLQTFFQGVGQTNYWQVLSEYGVGTPSTVIVNLGQAAPATLDDSTQDSALQQLLDGFIQDGKGGTPSQDGNTIYALVFPEGTTITDSGGTSCTDFGGYHTEDSQGNPYIVLPRCSGASEGFENDLQVATGAASHEMVEAATDPSGSGYAQVDSAHLYFDEANSGSELADMCENEPEAFWIFPDFAFVVQRIWSNVAAMAGWDPCVPAYTGEVYFNGAPTTPDTTTFDYNGAGHETADNSANIAAGSSGTVTVQVYSDGSSATPLTVGVFDFACLISGSTSGDLLSFTLASSGSGVTCGAPPAGGFACITEQCTGLSNGDTVTVTTKVITAGNTQSNGEVTDTELFGVLTSQGGTGPYEGFANLWWGLVGGS